MKPAVRALMIDRHIVIQVIVADPIFRKTPLTFEDRSFLPKTTLSAMSLLLFSTRLNFSLISKLVDFCDLFWWGIYIFRLEKYMFLLFFLQAVGRMPSCIVTIASFFKNIVSVFENSSASISLKAVLGFEKNDLFGHLSHV